MCREGSPWSSPRWRHVGLRLTRSTRCVLARGRHRQGAGVARGVRVTPPFAAVAAAPPPRALAAVRRLRGGPAAVGARGDVEVGQGAVGGAGRDVGVVRQRRGPAARLFPRPPARGVLTVVPVLVEAPGAPARKQNFRGAFTRQAETFPPVRCGVIFARPTCWGRELVRRRRRPATQVRRRRRQG